MPCILVTEAQLANLVDAGWTVEDGPFASETACEIFCGAQGPQGPQGPIEGCDTCWTGEIQEDGLPADAPRTLVATIDAPGCCIDGEIFTLEYIPDTCGTVAGCIWEGGLPVTCFGEAEGIRLICGAGSWSIETESSHPFSSCWQDSGGGGGELLSAVCSPLEVVFRLPPNPNRPECCEVIITFTEP